MLYYNMGRDSTLPNLSTRLSEILTAIAKKTNHEPKLRGKGYITLCPAHEDKRPSLSITEGSEGKILLKCFSGCSLAEICDVLDIMPRDLFPKLRGR